MYSYKIFLMLLQLAICILCAVLAYNDIIQSHYFHYFSDKMSLILVILAFLIPFFLISAIVHRCVAFYESYSSVGIIFVTRLAVGFVFSIIALPYSIYKLWVHIEYPVLKWLIIAIIAIVIIFLAIISMTYNEEKETLKKTNNLTTEEISSKTLSSNLTYQDDSHLHSIPSNLSMPKSTQVIENEKHDIYIWQIKTLFRLRLLAVLVISVIMAFLLYHIIDITKQSADHNLLVQILLKQTNVDINYIKTMAISYLTEKELISITALTIVTISSLAVLIKVFLSPISTNIYSDDKLKAPPLESYGKNDSATISQKIVDAILNNAISNKNDKTR